MRASSAAARVKRQTVDGAVDSGLPAGRTNMASSRLTQFLPNMTPFAGDNLSVSGIGVFLRYSGHMVSNSISHLL